MNRHRFAAIWLAMVVFAPATPAGDEAPWPEELTNWVKVGDAPVFEGAGGDAWDQKIRERGWILYDSEKKEYVLWYTGYNDSKSQTKFLGRATSKDGLHWTRDPKNPIFDKGWVEDVCVVRRDGKYHMFAEGEKDNAHQLISDDGISWKELGKLDVRTESAHRSVPARSARRRLGSKTTSGDCSMSEWIAASGWRLRRTARSARPARRSRVFSRTRALRSRGDRDQSSDSARRLLLRVLPRQRRPSRQDLDDLPRPLARSYSLGEMPQEPNPRFRRLKRRAGRRAERPAPLYDASEGIRV